MLVRIILIVVLLIIVAGLGTCGYLMCNANPGDVPGVEKADRVVEISRNDVMIGVYLYNSKDAVEVDVGVELYKWWEWDGQNWLYIKNPVKPLKITSAWGDIVIRDRQ